MSENIDKKVLFNYVYFRKKWKSRRFFFSPETGANPALFSYLWKKNYHIKKDIEWAIVCHFDICKRWAVRMSKSAMEVSISHKWSE